MTPAVHVLSNGGGEVTTADLLQTADEALAEVALVLAVLETHAHGDIADAWIAQRLGSIEAAAEEPERVRSMPRRPRRRPIERMFQNRTWGVAALTFSKSDKHTGGGRVENREAAYEIRFRSRALTRRGSWRTSGPAGPVIRETLSAEEIAARYPTKRSTHTTEEKP
jgi:hypothetical protein